MCLTLMWDQSWLGLQPQSLHFTIICCPEVTQNSRWLVAKALSAGAAGMLFGRIHMHIHSIWRLTNTLHVSGIDVGSVLIGPTALITALHHHLLPRSYPDFLVTSHSFVSRGCWNVVRTNPYAHPQHMKVVKHLTCVWQWYGISFDWVYSLNHCNFTIICCRGVTQISRWLPIALSAGAAGML